ncbi:MAG: ABC transporter ATP-binding protein [Sandaracinaceae bacterium]|nr:ABC transporter ATP-binding protein [Sandaracinaceae bacterium]
MIEARDLTVTRDGRKVLDRVAFHAAAGEVTSILGPNGAGKSTLLAALAGLLPIEAGEVSIGGARLGELTAMQRARRVAYVPQRTELRSALQVETVVSHGRYAHQAGLGRPGPADLEAVEDALRKADVLELRGRRFDHLSTGEQRRVLLARALATQAEVILLDEPTAALDVRHALELHALLEALADDGLCLVAVLHGLDAARRHTRRATLIDRGVVVAAGPSDEVIAPDFVRAVYGVELVEDAALGFRLGGPA